MTRWGIGSVLRAELTRAACTPPAVSAAAAGRPHANVIISDTGNFVGAGNQTIGQYDTLPLACFGSVWVQTGPVSSN